MKYQLNRMLVDKAMMDEAVRHRIWGLDSIPASLLIQVCEEDELIENKVVLEDVEGGVLIDEEGAFHMDEIDDEHLY